MCEAWSIEQGFGQAMLCGAVGSCSRCPTPQQVPVFPQPCLAQAAGALWGALAAVQVSCVGTRARGSGWGPRDGHRMAARFLAEGVGALPLPTMAQPLDLASLLPAVRSTRHSGIIEGEQLLVLCYPQPAPATRS